MPRIKKITLQVFWSKIGDEEPKLFKNKIGGLVLRAGKNRGTKTVI